MSPGTLNILKRLASEPWPVALLVALLLTSFFLLSNAIQNTAQFGQLFSLLLVVNLLTLLLLIALISRHLFLLLRQYRQHAPGSRLTLRLVVMFVILALAPVSLVYYFSLQFLHRGIDSWFDLQVEKSLHDALELGQSSLDQHLRELLRLTRQAASELTSVQNSTAAFQLNDLRQHSSASEITLLTLRGRVIASASAEAAAIVPAMPSEAVLQQLRQGMEYARLEPLDGGSMQVRIAITLPALEPGTEARVLHALYPVTDRISMLANSVQETYSQYTELAFLRQPLKYSFTLTLSLILLLSLLTAVWAAFFFARRLVAPIRDLAEGTRAVAAGDYSKRLPLPGRDELGFLVRSFNEMTYKIAQSQQAVQQSQQLAEEQRAHLETVLSHLSSGVLTLDSEGVLHSSNAAASQILGIQLDGLLAHPLQQLIEQQPALRPLVNTIQMFLHSDEPDWRAELELLGNKGRQVLLCRGTVLPGHGDHAASGDHVIVFDDITALIQAQRDAAWGEVARRLAHEIKNPLTPIQLSAERLRHKYLGTMPSADAEVLDRATHTIVQQVENLKEMVKAFSDYARPPQLKLVMVDINRLIREVVELYQVGEYSAHFDLQLGQDIPLIKADNGRLRQIMHNLLKNALEADARPNRNISITSRCTAQTDCQYAELSICDDGPGIPADMLVHLFEPYVTSKPKGTGLGLAIVKKMVEEHNGLIWAENRAEGGVCVMITLPIAANLSEDI
ncbi:MAG: ATP-binding protein [Thiohalomonadaceae bacterium]